MNAVRYNDECVHTAVIMALPFVPTAGQFVAAAAAIDAITVDGNAIKSNVQMAVCAMTLRFCSQIARFGLDATYFVPVPLGFVEGKLLHLAVFFHALEDNGWDVRVVQRDADDAESIPEGRNVALYPDAGLRISALAEGKSVASYPLRIDGMSLPEDRDEDEAARALARESYIHVTVPTQQDATKIATAAADTDVVECVYFVLSQLLWSLTAGAAQVVRFPVGIVSDENDTVSGAVQTLRDLGWGVTDAVCDEFFGFCEIVLATDPTKVAGSSMAGDFILVYVAFTAVEMLIRVGWMPFYLLGWGLMKLAELSVTGAVLLAETAVAGARLGMFRMFASTEKYAVKKAEIYRAMGWRWTRRLRGDDMKRVLLRTLGGDVEVILFQNFTENMRNRFMDRSRTEEKRYGLWDDRRAGMFEKLTFDGQPMPSDPTQIDTSGLTVVSDVLGTIDAEKMLLDVAATAIASHNSDMGAINYYLWKLINRFMLAAYSVLPYGDSEEDFLMSQEGIYIPVMDLAEHLKIGVEADELSLAELARVTMACYIFQSLAASLGWNVAFAPVPLVQPDVPFTGGDVYAAALPSRNVGREVLSYRSFYSVNRSGLLVKNEARENWMLPANLGIQLRPRQASDSPELNLFPFDAIGRGVIVSAEAASPYYSRVLLQGEALAQLLAGLPAARHMRNPAYFNDLNIRLQTREFGRVQFEIQTLRLMHCLWARFALLADEADATTETPDEGLRTKFEIGVAINPMAYSAPEFTPAQLTVAVRTLADNLGWPVHRDGRIDLKTGHFAVVFAASNATDSGILTDVFFRQSHMNDWAVTQLATLGTQTLRTLLETTLHGTDKAQEPFTLVNRNSRVPMTVVYSHAFRVIKVAHVSASGKVVFPLFVPRSTTRFEMTTSGELERKSTTLALPHENPGVSRFIEVEDTQHFVDENEQKPRTQIPVFLINKLEFLLDVQHDHHKQFFINGEFDMPDIGSSKQAILHGAPYRLGKVTLRFAAGGSTIEVADVFHVESLEIDMAAGGTCVLKGLACDTLYIRIGGDGAVRGVDGCKVTRALTVAGSGKARIEGFQVGAECAMEIGLSDEATAAIDALPNKSGARRIYHGPQGALAVTAIAPEVEAPPKKIEFVEQQIIV